MNGLISSHPSQASVRLALGGSLLLLVQSGMLLLAPLAPNDRMLILVLSPIAIAALGTALIGPPAPSPHRWRARHES